MQLWDAVHWKPLGARVPAYNPINPAWLIAPGARFIASWDMKGVEVRDPATLSRRWFSPSPASDVAYSAWAIDPQARWLAIADTHGAVSLADPSTGQVRRLLPGPASWTHWLQFSGDGAWLAAGSEDGSVWVWRRDDDFTRGRRLDIGTPVRSLSVDPGTGLIVAGDEDSVGVWQLSGLGEADRAALPRAPLFRHSQEIPRYASDLHAASGCSQAQASMARSGSGACRARRSARGRAAANDVRTDVRRRALRRGKWRTRASDEGRGGCARLAGIRPSATGRIRSAQRRRADADHHQRTRTANVRLAPRTTAVSAAGAAELAMKLALQGSRAYVTYGVERGRPLTEAVVRAVAGQWPRAGATSGNPRWHHALLPSPDGTYVALLTNTGLQLLDGRTLQQAGPAERNKGDAMIVAAGMDGSGSPSPRPRPTACACAICFPPAHSALPPRPKRPRP